MGLSDFPRVAFSSGPDLPVPVGFISSPELLEHLFAAWWGCDLTDKNTVSFDPFFHTVKIEPLNTIGRAIAQGQITECADVIRKACLERDLNGFVPKDAANPAGERVRLQPSDWRHESFISLKSELMIGKIARFRDEHLSWADQRPFLFPETESETWLRGLVSPHLMPEPLRRDPSGLPDRAYVYLCEVVTWLADGAAIHLAQATNDMMEANDRAVAIEEDRASAFDQMYCPEMTDPAQRNRWLAVAVAQDRRRSDVAKVMQSLVATGDLEAFGVREPTKVHGYKPEQISRDLFLSDVGLNWIKDALEATGSSEDNERYLEARAQGTWTGVRCRKADVVARWGSEPNAQKRRTRGATHDWDGAEAEYRRLMDYHGALSSSDPDWSRKTHVVNAILDWFRRNNLPEPDAKTVGKKITDWDN